MIGPGIAEADFSVTKEFPIRETMNLQLRAECFNLANHPSFQAPSNATRQIFNTAGQLSSTEGVLTATTTSSRQIQFGLKLVF